MGVPVQIITEPQPLTVSLAVDKELAIKAGSRLFGNVKVAVDPTLLTEEDRNTLIDCGLDLTAGYDRRPMPKIGTVDENTLPALLAAWRQTRAAFAADVEAKVQEVINYPAEKMYSITWDKNYINYERLIEFLEQFDHSKATVKDVDKSPHGFSLAEAMNAVQEIVMKNGPWVAAMRFERVIGAFYSDRFVNAVSHHSLLLERKPALDAEAARLQEQYHKRAACAVERNRDLLSRLQTAAAEAKAAKDAAEKAAGAAAEKAKADQIAAFVQEHGTEGQKARFAESLLPEEEVVDAMRDHAFRPLAEQPRYKKISKDDVVRAADDDDLDPYDDDPAVEYKAWTAEEASDAEFATFQAIRDAIRADHPDAAVELVEHAGGLETSKDWAIFRKSVKVTLQVGTFTFSREYACP